MACLLLVVAGCGADEGSGTLEAFVRLGSNAQLAGLAPAELGTADGQELEQALEHAEISNMDEVRAALSYVPPADRRGFAFVMSGCEEDGAVLTVERDTLTADLTGGENVDCAQANYFLAVLSAERDSIPPTATLSR